MAPSRRLPTGETVRIDCGAEECERFRHRVVTDSAWHLGCRSPTAATRSAALECRGDGNEDHRGVAPFARVPASTTRLAATACHSREAATRCGSTSPRRAFKDPYRRRFDVALESEPLAREFAPADAGFAVAQDHRHRTSTSRTGCFSIELIPARARIVHLRHRSHATRSRVMDCAEPRRGHEARRWRTCWRSQFRIGRTSSLAIVSNISARGDELHRWCARSREG